MSNADVSEVIFYDCVVSDIELGSMRTYSYHKYLTVDYAPPVPDELMVDKTCLGKHKSRIAVGNPADEVSF